MNDDEPILPSPTHAAPCSEPSAGESVAEPPTAEAEPVTGPAAEDTAQNDAAVEVVDVEVSADCGGDLDLADADAELLSAIPLPVRVEAALFAAVEPLGLKRLKELTACPDGRLLREAVDALAAGYVRDGRAFRVEEVALGFQLRTSADVAVVVQRLGRRPADEKLSAAGLETLAIVAYRQPVLRADIEKIRGVACGEVLRSLQERGMVRVAGRAELPGSPILYGTTQRFLEVFGLRDLAELPKDREVLGRAATGI